MASLKALLVFRVVEDQRKQKYRQRVLQQQMVELQRHFHLALKEPHQDQQMSMHPLILPSSYFSFASFYPFDHLFKKRELAQKIFLISLKLVELNQF